ncbi:DUF418 domain-containing protein [Planococcus sp. CP5-4]|uniref:DUF418 domain-containing protein n=1 Tax=unclassified Planococcus (in: firmicutes) TaxID=2662419 RepID=UPI001C233855|nr:MULTISPECIES: DUF418 domain-containing protein [unclassified Planococcus (in: firmicutes)]MBU9674943.1 DUF418 domain-containing protein [Planococcus sp. CP5-4_YE]MBV0908406.1 DUF418 domain-containing protein [Planococcus sp. CP5-4_UN]MBW6062620.1 DUF418 domain-containing protein [Planococcus sp. CP5-4]
MKSRIRVADALRGFSLLGIILANLLIFQYGVIGKGYISFYELDAPSLGIYYFIKVFIEYSAMPIFTFLFGFSLIKLRDSLMNKGKGIKRNILRRALMLIGIGLLHATFIWEGDILVFYGLSCFLLIFFLGRTREFLVKSFVAVSILTISASFFPIEENLRAIAFGGDMTEGVRSYLMEAKAVYGQGSYSEINDFASELPAFFDFPIGLMFGMYLISQLSFLFMFLLGMIAAKSNWFTDIESYSRKYRVAVWLIPAGVALKIPHLIEGHPITDGLFTAGSFILAIGYVAFFVLMYHKYQSSRIMGLFEAVGKLSLTNYLMQSVLMTSIFYGYGLGLFGNSHLWIGFVLAIGVYALQMAASSMYLNYFSQGPIEYLLRVGTYLSLKGKSKEALPVQFSSDKVLEKL